MFSRFLSRAHPWLEAFLLLVMFLMIRQLQRINAELDKDLRTYARLETGDVFEHLHANNLDGGFETFAFLDTAATLFVFQPGCPECARAAKFWNQTVERHPGERYIGLSAADAEKSRAYAAAQGFRFPVYVWNDPGQHRSHRITQFPKTIRVEGGIATYVGAFPALEVGDPFYDMGAQNALGFSDTLRVGGEPKDFLFLGAACPVCKAMVTRFAAMPDRKPTKVFLYDPDSTMVAPGETVFTLVSRDVMRVDRLFEHHMAISVGADRKITRIEHEPGTGLVAHRPAVPPGEALHDGHDHGAAPAAAATAAR